VDTNSSDPEDENAINWLLRLKVNDVDPPTRPNGVKRKRTQKERKNHKNKRNRI